MSAFSHTDSIVSAPDSPALSYYHNHELRRNELSRGFGTTKSYLRRPVRSIFSEDFPSQPFHSNSSTMMEMDSEVHSAPIEIVWDIPKRSKRATTVQIVRRMVGKGERIQLDESTIPKMRQKDFYRAERKKLEQLDEYQRKVVMRQLAEKEQEKQMLQPEAETRKSVKRTLKNVIEKTKSKKKKAKRCQHCQKDQKPEQVEPLTSSSGPELRSETENTSPITYNGRIIAELPGSDTVDCHLENSDADESIVKRPLVEHRDEADTPAYELVRSLSPVSPPSSTAYHRRGHSFNQTRTGSSAKQMQCDECHEPIRLTQTYFSCSECEVDEKIYCFRCADDGRTCRHSLDEKTRNIRRFATNPQNIERRLQNLQNATAFEMAPAEPSVPTTSSSGFVISPSAPSQLANASTTATSTALQQQAILKEASPPVSPISTLGQGLEASDPFQFLTRRREQEISYLKELNLVKSQALFIQKETAQAWIQQQYCAAALRQQHEKSAGIGSQFTSNSASFQQNSSSQSEQHVSRQSSSASTKSGINLESPTTTSRKISDELACAIAGYEASANGIIKSKPRMKANGNNSNSTATSRDRGRASQPDSPPVKKLSGRRTGKGRESEDEDDDDDEQDGRAFKRQKSDSSDAPPHKLWACPYSKCEPSRYSLLNSEEINYRGCTGVICRDISRIKQHLKRKHHKPEYYCRRCFLEFRTEDQINAHSSEDQACVVKSCPWPEKLDEAKQKAIHTKKPGKDAEQQWFDMFAVIFPGVPLPDSPYVEAPTTPQGRNDSVELVLQIFEEKLNEQSQRPGCEWLQQEAVRAIIRQVASETQSTVRNRIQPLPALFVSPVSPPSEQNKWDAQNPSPVSSPASQKQQTRQRRQRSLQVPSPVKSPGTNPTKAQLKSALRVRTSGNGMSADASPVDPSSGSSARSGVLPFGVNARQDTTLDAGWDGPCGSWGPGDDQYIMDNVLQKVKEPCSATSSGSRKSVTFQTPPQQPIEDETDWPEEPSTHRKPAPSIADSGYDTTSYPRSEFDYSHNIPDQYHIQPLGGNVMAYSPDTIDPQMLSSHNILMPGLAAMNAANFPHLNIVDPSQFAFASPPFMTIWPQTTQPPPTHAQMQPQMTMNFQQQQQQNVKQMQYQQQHQHQPVQQNQNQVRNYDGPMFGGAGGV